MNDSSASTANSAVSHNEISARAQQLWENYGRPVGRDQEIWLQAEQDLLRTHVTPPAPTPAVAETAAVPPVDQPRAKSPSAPRKASGRTSKTQPR